MGMIRRRLGAFALAVCILVGILALVGKQRRAANMVTLKTATVSRGTVTTSVSGTGTLEPLATVEVKSNVGGAVIYLGADEGDVVKTGQVLAKIDPADARTTLSTSQADLDSARAKMQQAQYDYTRQKTQYPTQVNSAQQAAQAARVKLLQAQRQAGLQKQLTKTTLEQARQGVAAARAKLAQTQAQAKLQPQLIETAISQAKSNLAAAQSAYQQQKGALVSQKVAAAQTALSQAKANFSYAEKERERKRQLMAKGFVPRSDVDTAEQQYDVSKASLESAQNKFDTIKAETAEDLSSASAKVEQAQAALRSAEANRVQIGISQKDVESARASLSQAEASLRSAEANRVQDSLKGDDVRSAVASLAQAEASLASVRADAYQVPMKQDDIVQSEASVKRSEATVDNARTQLGYTVITAPCDGVVVERDVDKGSIVTAGRASTLSGSGSGVTIMQVADVSRMFAKVSIDETDISQIQTGQEVDVTVDAYPDELFKGKVTKIAPKTVTDQNVTSIPVTVEIDSPDRRLKPGMNATCDFVTARKSDVLTVPNAAVKNAGGQTRVLVAVNGKPVPREVQVGLSDNDNTEIMSGLQEGDVVVTAVNDPRKQATTGSTQGSSSGRSGSGGMRRMGGPGGMPPGP